MKKLSTLLPTLLLGVNILAQNCIPFDLSFGTGGKALGYTSNQNSPQSANILIQPDNKIIQIGTVSSGNKNAFGIVRYKANGSLDSLFGINGVVTTNSTINENYYGRAGALQADGKIIVIGNTSNSSFFRMIRYNTNGKIDSSFGQNGVAVTTPGIGYEYAEDIKIQGDGKIIVGGTFSDSAGASAFGLILFKTNGTVDSSFGKNGKIISHAGHFITYIGAKYYGQYSDEAATTVHIQTDGKILIGGRSYSHEACYDYYGYAYCNPAFALLRYNNDGKLDSTFGINGKVMDSTLLVEPRTIAVQPDGKIVVTGVSWYQDGFVTERYNANGSLDPGFGTAGKISTILASPPTNSQASSLALQSDGKIVVAGNLETYGNGIYTSKFAVARYTTNGILDNSFNSNGTAVFNVGQSVDQATAIAIQGSAIIIAGRSYTNNGTNNGNLVLVRLLDNAPILPVTVTANSALTFCEGGQVKLSADKTGTVQWYRNNVLINGATNTDYTTSSSGSYTVTVNNANGCGTSAPVVITVKNNPLKPIINWNSSQFSTSPGLAHYQWLLNNIVIAGVDSNVYKPVQPGLYKVIVTDNAGCSTASDVFNLVVVAVNTVAIGDASLKYYPNPAQTVLHIDVISNRSRKLTADLYDNTGKLMQKQSLNQTNNKIPVQNLPTGVYQLVIYNTTEKTVLKILVIR